MQKRPGGKSPWFDFGAPPVWQTVKKPVEVHEKVQATIDRAKQGTCLPD